MTEKEVKELKDVGTETARAAAKILSVVNAIKAEPQTKQRLSEISEVLIKCVADLFSIEKFERLAADANESRRRYDK